MDIEIVALDVDGTLLTDDFRLTPATVQAVQEVHRKGIKIVLCSGRGPQSILPVLDELGLSGVAVAHNGALVVRSEDRGVLAHRSFGFDAVAPYVRYARENGLHVDACSFFDLYVEELSPELAGVYARFHVQPVLVNRLEDLDRPLVKCTMSGTEQDLDRAEQALPEEADGMRRIRSGEHFIDVMRSDVSKGQALASLARGWRVDPSRILAIGNYYNDLDMIRLAGWGIAMGNSPDRVRREADFVADTNNADGVAKALRHYLLE